MSLGYYVCKSLGVTGAAPFRTPYTHSQVTALLTDFFGPYKAIGKVRELSVTFEAAKKELFQHAFTDFRQHVQHRNEASEAALRYAHLQCLSDEIRINDKTSSLMANPF